MAHLPELKTRRLEDYKFHLEYRTRWSDNDMYSHMNNSIYYFLFDSIVNTYLSTHCAHSPSTSALIGLVVHSHCDYFAPISFPAVVDLGLRVKKLGASSVVYEIGVFERGDGGEGGEGSEGLEGKGGERKGGEVKAVGEFVHVFVGRDSRRPMEGGMGEVMRTGLGKLMWEEQAKL